ncbi:MAG TPA: hypothetical protein VFR23_18110, partial [Jiangellaceae bacterium]|nr:hypothetical protein [Jiangellaceae bacterium]
MALVFFESASELATLTNTFTVSGTPTDPTTISLIITDPEGTETTYTYAAVQITRTSAGIYTKAITCNKAGTWTYEWVGTGAATDTQAGTWEVYEPELGRLYATVEALKSRLSDTATADDLEYHAACFAASRAVESLCDRVFYRSASASRTFEPCDLYRLQLGSFNDLVTLTTLKTDAAGDGTFETTWAATDYQLYPVNPAAAPESRPYTEVRAVGSQTFPVPYSRSTRVDRVEITGIWGWPKVPYAVKQATL